MFNFLKKNSIVIGGGAIQGAGMGLFLFPHAIPSGGAGGLAVILNHWFHLDMGFALWLVNFSMLAVAVKYLGGKSTLWTMVSISITSASIFAVQHYIPLPNQNPWVDLVIGSLLLGIGVGMLLKEKVSNGGIGVIALVISNKREILPGKPLFLINCLIFLLTASIIKWDIIFQALLSQWIATRVVDYICNKDSLEVYTIDWRKKL
ncbi:YitT family protein [Bacillus sp. AK128]